MSGASERANGRASDPVLQSVVLLFWPTVEWHANQTTVIGGESNCNTFHAVSSTILTLGKRTKEVETRYVKVKLGNIRNNDEKGKKRE